MHTTTINKLLKAVENSPVLSIKQKKEMHTSLSITSDIIEKTPEEINADIQSIINFTVCAVYEIIRPDRNSNLASLTRKGLMLSVKKMEDSEPDLYEAVINMCDVLSGIGL